MADRLRLQPPGVTDVSDIEGALKLDASDGEDTATLDVIGVVDDEDTAAVGDRDVEDTVTLDVIGVSGDEDTAAIFTFSKFSTTSLFSTGTDLASFDLIGPLTYPSDYSFKNIETSC